VAGTCHAAHSPFEQKSKERDQKIEQYTLYMSSIHSCIRIYELDMSYVNEIQLIL
jgi:hypothetical protein